MAQRAVARSRSALVPGRLDAGTVAEVLAASDLHVAPAGRTRSPVAARGDGRRLRRAGLGHRAAPRSHPPGRTGLLVDARDADTLARQALAVLDDPEAHRPLGDAAAAMVREQFSQDVCLPQLAEQFGSLAAARGGWR